MQERKSLKTQSKEMTSLLKKEKDLHREIRADFKRITDKINLDFEQIQKTKLKK